MTNYATTAKGSLLHFERPTTGKTYCGRPIAEIRGSAETYYNPGTMCYSCQDKIGSYDKRQIDKAQRRLADSQK